MGIRIAPKNKAKESSKLLSKILAYLFEQECGDLKYASKDDIAKINAAKTALTNIINKANG